MRYHPYPVVGCICFCVVGVRCIDVFFLPPNCGTSSCRSTKADKDVKKKGGGGFAKLCSLSPQLQTFIGEAVLARTEVFWS